MSLYGALAEAVREGKELMAGIAALDGSGEAAIDTPFAEVTAVVLTKMDAAPTIVPWYAVASGVVTITGDASVDVSYVIIGRRRQ